MADTVPPREVFGSITSFMPFGELGARQVLLDVGGRWVERLAGRETESSVL